MQIIRRFGVDAYARALESWNWLEGLAGTTPALTSVFVDVFLGDEDGSFWFLDTWKGGWIGSGRTQPHSKPTSTRQRHKTTT